MKIGSSYECDGDIVPFAKVMSVMEEAMDFGFSVDEGADLDNGVEFLELRRPDGTLYRRFTRVVDKPSSHTAVEHLEQIWQRWFMNGHDGLTFQAFVQGIGADLDAALAVAREEAERVLAVRYLHRARNWNGITVCTECSHWSPELGYGNTPVDYPCDTVKALEGDRP